MQDMTRFDDFLEKQLENKEFKKEYQSLKAWRDLQTKLINARKKAKLTQEELAEILELKRANLSKFETSLENPTFNTLFNYARAVGLKKLVVDLS